LIVGAAEQGKAGTGFAEFIAFDGKSFGQVLPVFGIRDVIGEKRPQGCDEPLISPYGLFRSVPPEQVTPDCIAYQ